MPVSVISAEFYLTGGSENVSAFFISGAELIFTGSYPDNRFV